MSEWRGNMGFVLQRATRVPPDGRQLSAGSACGCCRATAPELEGPRFVATLIRLFIRQVGCSLPLIPRPGTEHRTLRLRSSK